MTLDRAHKLDPSRPSLRFGNPDTFAGKDEHVAVATDRVAMARRRGAVADSITLPLTSYRGVAIRILQGATEEEDRVAVVLSHADSAFDVALYEAGDDSDVIAEWRAWGSALGLPLLMEDADGRTVVAETRLGDVVVERPRPRRRRSFLSGRRPRFLNRRRTAKLPSVPFVHRDEREIIAPE